MSNKIIINNFKIIRLINNNEGDINKIIDHLPNFCLGFCVGYWTVVGPPPPTMS